MSLIKCSKCNNQISDTAKFCPHCGEMRKPLINKKLIFCGCGAIIVSLLLIVFLLGGNNSIVGDVQKIIENDLGTSVKITTLYYNEEQQVCLAEFETITAIDVAAIYLEDNKVLYDSDSEYWQKKFNNATSSSERGKYSSKVLEYSDLIEWKFGVAVNGTPEKTGWERIK